MKLYSIIYQNHHHPIVIPSHNHGGYTGNDVFGGGYEYNSEYTARNTLPDLGSNERRGEYNHMFHGYAGTTDPRNNQRILSQAFHTHPITSNGGGESHNNLPPYMVLGYFIYKARSNQI